MGEPLQEDLRHEWHFTIGAVFPSDSPLARFVVAVGGALNDNILSNSLFVQAGQGHERLYLFNLASSHLFEAAETFRQAHREWEEVREFVATLEVERRDEFARITALAAPNAAWPGDRLKAIRNSFFHYLRLDRAAANAGQLPIARGLAEAVDLESSLVIEPGAGLSGIRALFADEVLVKTITDGYEDGELEQLVDALATYQGDLNRFAQAAIGRYIREQPDGVVRHEAQRA